MIGKLPQNNKSSFILTIVVADLIDGLIVGISQDDIISETAWTKMCKLCKLFYSLLTAT